MIPVEVTSVPWHITTLLDLFDHWRTLLAGLLALTAGFLTVLVTRSMAKRQIAAARADADRVIAASDEQTRAAADQTATIVRLEKERLGREVDALRAALAGEIRLYVDLMINTRTMLGMRETRFLSALDNPSTQRDLRSLAVLPDPTVYPVVADRMGLMQKPAAAAVVDFYATIERLNLSVRLATNEPDKKVSVTNYLALGEEYAEACRRSVPLLAELPFDAGDAALIAKIEAMKSAGDQE